MTRRGLVRIGVALLLALGVLGGGIAFFWGGGPRKVNAGHPEWEDGEPEQVAIKVTTAHPRYDASFAMTARRPADVEAYYATDLESRVPGVVRWVKKDVGNKVKAGEALVELDVPDLEQTVKEKESKVEERRSAWRLARANIRTARAFIETAKNNVLLMETSVLVAESTRWFRSRYLGRMRDLRSGNNIEQGVVDEADRNFQAAVAGKQAAVLSVTKAKLEVEDAEAKLAAAEEDVNLKKALIDVAQNDVAFARAMREFATIRAPYDGVIVRRYVGPGSFVQNASNGQRGTPILSMQRSDIVTVTMRLPDKFTPYVTAGTEAIIEVDPLPGLKIKGAVTRFAPSLVSSEHDRTMLVEVELWNGSLEEFQAFEAREKAGTVPFGEAAKDARKIPFGDLKMGLYDEATGALLVRVPHFEGKPSSARRAQLLPGMFGRMTLVLRKFDNTRLLPSSAVVNQGGYSYVYLVQEGKAHLQPVQVQADDGKLVKVELLGPQGEVAGDLTGGEEVIVSNQGELAEGQPVQPSLMEGWTMKTFARREER